MTRALRMLERLEETWRNCGNCRELAARRTNVVHWRGNPSAPLALIGEAPGADEDEQGRPFVGRAGVLLDELLKRADLDPDQHVLIANRLACRPPGNRKPKPAELAACSVRLQYLLGYAVRPRVLLLMGATAAQLAGVRGALGKARGEKKSVEMLDYSKRAHRWPAIVTYHPAYLLRVNDTDVEAEVVRDVRRAFRLTKAKR